MDCEFLTFDDAPHINIAIVPISNDGPRRHCETTATTHALTQLLAHFLSTPHSTLPTLISHHPDGAPFLPLFPDIAISISHCRDLAAVAIADSHSPSFGIDIETPRPQQLRNVAPRFLSTGDILSTGNILPTEHTKGHSLPDDNTDTSLLLTAWTIKEAVFKATCQSLTPTTTHHTPQNHTLPTPQNHTLPISLQDITIDIPGATAKVPGNQTFRIHTRSFRHAIITLATRVRQTN